MQAFPHHYQVRGSAEPDSNVQLAGAGLPTITSAPPVQFGGSGECWSPEDLLVAAVADCFILSFKSVAHVSAMEWTSLSCDVEGVLERIERVTKFTRFILRATLVVPATVDVDKARRLLEKAEAACLVSNSLSATIDLQCEVLSA